MSGKPLTLLLSLFLFACSTVPPTTEGTEQQTTIEATAQAEEAKPQAIFSENSQVNDAMHELLNAHRLTSSRTGYSGSPSQSSQAFKLIRRQKDAKALFSALYANAENNEAKIYALTGLYNLDRKQYNALKESLNKEEKVVIVEGCVLDRYTIDKALQQIENKKMLRMIVN